MKTSGKVLNKTLLSIVMMVTLSISLLLTFITFSLNLTPEFNSLPIWLSASFIPTGAAFPVIAILLITAFIATSVLFIFSLIFLITKKTKSRGIVCVHIFFNLSLLFVILFLDVLFNLYAPGVLAILIINLILNVGAIFAYKLYDNIFKAEDNIESTSLNFPSISTLIVDILGSIFMLTMLFIPLFSKPGEHYVLNVIFKSYTNAIDIEIIGMIMVVLYIVGLIVFVSSISSFLSKRTNYVKKSRNLFRYNLSITLVFFFIGFIYVFLNRVNNSEASTISYIPLVLMSILAIVSAYIKSHIKDIDNTETARKKRNGPKIKFFPLIFVSLFTLVTVCSLFFTIIEIKFNAFDTIWLDTSLTGLDLLRDYGQLDVIYQVMAFIYGVIIFTSLVLFVLCVVSFFGRSKEHYKLAKSSAYTNVSLLFLLALIGAFFMFNQKILDTVVMTILEYFGLEVPVLYEYTINTDMIYIFLVSLLILVVMFLTRQLNHNVLERNLAAESLNSKKEKEGNATKGIADNKEEMFDPCPAFSELDSKKPQYEENLRIKQKSLFKNASLPEIVNFVVNYARDSRLHLSYSHEDIATFVAGLGASRLAILQGMSGTGKTSLPKIFAEAIMGNCDLVEVESSWRDKNELLGYYNEFSRRFTPKKFTQYLYKAKLNPNVPTLIVLDELNLSRIEYYFSDFLSLMENEEHKREIKILNIKIAPIGFEDKESYLALKDDHTLEIPKNVWFIGTANRDESTFEISDKVYDRAQTMNFYKRAPKVRAHNEEMPPRFLPYDVLAKLFVQAKLNMQYDAENDFIVQEVEKLLMPFNISFGNRILNQIEEFVKIYCACFSSVSEVSNKEILRNAVENILYSKVVRKLEIKQIDNKEKLAISFDKLNLSKCSAFIRTLDEE